MLDDSIDYYRHDPLHWAALVVLDYIVKDDAEQLSEINLQNVLINTGAYEFIVENFNEKGFKEPSVTQIVNKVLDISSYHIGVTPARQK